MARLTSLTIKNKQMEESLAAKKLDQTPKAGKTPLKSLKPAKPLLKSLEDGKTPLKAGKTPLKFLRAAKTPLKSLEDGKMPLKTPHTFLRAAKTPLKSLEDGKTPLKTPHTFLRAAKTSLKSLEDGKMPLKTPHTFLRAAKTSLKSLEDGKTPLKTPLKFLRAAKTPLKSVEDGKTPLKSVEDGKTPLKSVEDGKTPLKISLKILKAVKTPLKSTGDGKTLLKSLEGGKTPFKAGKKTPLKLIEDGKTPLKSLEDGKTPLKSLEDGKTPLKSLEDGKTPLKSLKDGKTPLKSLEDGKTPIKSLEGRKTPLKLRKSEQIPVVDEITILNTSLEEVKNVKNCGTKRPIEDDDKTCPKKVKMTIDCNDEVLKAQYERLYEIETEKSIHGLDKLRLSIQWLPKETTVDELMEAFPKCTNAEKHAHTAFVTFSSETDAKKAFDGAGDLVFHKKKVAVLYASFKLKSVKNVESLPKKKEFSFFCSNEEINAQYERLVELDNRSLFIPQKHMTNEQMNKKLSGIYSNIVFNSNSRRLLFDTEAEVEKNKQLLEKDGFKVGYYGFKEGITSDLGIKQNAFALDRMKLTVLNIREDTTLSQVQKAFPKHKEIKISNGEGYVTFSSMADAKEAFDNSLDLLINGCKVGVLYSTIINPVYLEITKLDSSTRKGKSSRKRRNVNPFTESGDDKQTKKNKIKE